MTQRRSRRNVLRALGAFGLPIAGSFVRTASAAETYTMRLGLADTPASVFALAALSFADAVARRSNGQLKIEVFPSGELAKERESIDGLISGVLDFTIQSPAFLEPLFPRFQIFDLPFLVKDLANGYRILDGPIGADLFADLAIKGILGLTWGVNGLREIETSKPIVVPEDMRGLRIRNVGGVINAATYQALGAIPVAIDFSETFTALAQHTVDAVDFPLDGFTTNKWYNVVKHVSMTNHIFSVAPLMGSKRKIETLPVGLQKTIGAEAKALLPTWRSLFSRHLTDNMVVLRNNGVTFSEIQYPAFRKAVEPVYALVQSRIGEDLMDRVRQATNG